ncbi:MAG: signal peptide peptidase SppA [Treponema sp.]|jgi:protease-4|nr:signal peptide peptidase SppA [Treponema sp.]
MKLNVKLLVLGACLLMTRPLFAQNAFLELNLNSQRAQKFTRSMRSNSSLEVLRVIEQAGNDRKIAGIILNISTCQEGRETLWELRNALEKFKAKGKKVCAFISGADLDLYCLATVGDKIVMDDQGVLMLTGYVWGRGYAKHSLEKLGIGAREMRYFKYKSAAESYTRDSLSEADRAQYGEILDDMTQLARDTLYVSRSWNTGEFDRIINNEFMFSAKNALARGLVDNTGRKESVLDAVMEISDGNAAESFLLYGDAESSLTGSKFPYKLGKAGGMFSRPPVIAVINANGVTDMERGIAAWTLSKTIRELSERRRVKAIVLRINSPGGSAEAADYVAEAVKAAKERVPVVVSMGAVAASGGYWASMSASRIVATPVTLTGSIGVIASWFYDKGLNSKLGLSVDIMQRGTHADMTSGVILPRRDLNSEEEARYKEYILDLYSDFTQRVAANRNMDIERVEELAQGRVYSGFGALNAGLIDSIGGIDDAISIARELANIPDNRKIAIMEYPKPKFFDKMLEYLFSSRADSLTKTSAIDAAAELFFPALSGAPPILEDLRFRMAHNGRVMPILPLD